MQIEHETFALARWTCRLIEMRGSFSVVLADVQVQVAGSNGDEHVCNHGETRGT
jgi:hypothetical protein